MDEGRSIHTTQAGPAERDTKTQNKSTMSSKIIIRTKAAKPEIDEEQKAKDAKEFAKYIRNYYDNVTVVMADLEHIEKYMERKFMDGQAEPVEGLHIEDAVGFVEDAVNVLRDVKMSMQDRVRDAVFAADQAQNMVLRKRRRDSEKHVVLDAYKWSTEEQTEDKEDSDFEEPPKKKARKGSRRSIVFKK